jgi:hypothetical protein
VISNQQAQQLIAQSQVLLAQAHQLASQ